MKKKYDPQISCCYLYPITKYGYPPPASDTNTFLKEMYSLGFQSIELEGIHEQHLMEVYNNIDTIQQTVKTLKVEIPYFCTVLPGLSSPDDAQRSHYVEVFSKGCEIAEKLGSKGVLDNSPLPPYIFPNDIPVTRHYDEHSLRQVYFPKDLNWKIYWLKLISTYQELCDIAAEKNLTYQVHPCLGALVYNTDAFLYFYDAVGRNNLRFNLDTANQYYLKDNLILSLTRLKDFIDYIHISDNSGSRLEHLEIGKGHINFKQFFHTLDSINYKGTFGLDIGGAESDISNLDEAYQNSAQWISNHWIHNR